MTVIFCAINSFCFFCDMKSCYLVEVAIKYCGNE